MKRIISSLILLTFIGLSKAQPQFYDGAIDSASKAVMAKAEQDIEKYRKNIEKATLRLCWLTLMGNLSKT